MQYTSCREKEMRDNGGKCTFVTDEEGERDRDRERETERKKETKRDRQTKRGRQTDREIKGETARER